MDNYSLGYYCHSSDYQNFKMALDNSRYSIIGVFSLFFLPEEKGIKV